MADKRKGKCLPVCASVLCRAGRKGLLNVDIQKAALWKRVAAGLLDFILLITLAVGAAWGVSSLLDFDAYNQKVEEAYDRYEAEYGVDFAIAQEDFLAMTEAERENFDAAYEALIADEEAMYAYNMMIHLLMVITTAGLLLAHAVLEFAVPLLIGNGQTLGKKAFSLALMRTDGVKINPLQLFTRGILGKFTLETMIPVYLALMTFFGMLGTLGSVLLMGIGILQVVLLAATRNNSLLHDLCAGTVVVDMSSQMIFRSTDDLVAYQKRVAAERAARSDY